MSSLGRRSFLSLSGGAALAGVFGAIGLDRAAASSTQADKPRSRVLVLVDLQGGNDALNTLVPQAGRYRDLRSALAIPEDDLLTFEGLEFGVHPSLAALQGLWEADQLVGVYGTGFEAQNRSHFEAQDAWRTGDPALPGTVGWLGRWLEASIKPHHDPLRAITIGQSSLAARGASWQPVSIRSLHSIGLASPLIADAVRDMSSPLQPGLLAEAQRVIPDAIGASQRLQDVLAPVDFDETANPDLDVSSFRAVAAIIQAGLGTQVICLTIDGFDTHALQAERHTTLLQVLGDGLAQMFSELELSGHADDTLALVVSEFGRRVAENGSEGAEGTDHGRGGLSFLVGPAIAQRVVVGEPDLSDLVDGDLRITTDARVLYDEALRWLGATEDEVASVLNGRWEGTPLLLP